MTKVLEFQLQHQSFQWIVGTEYSGLNMWFSAAAAAKLLQSCLTLDCSMLGFPGSNSYPSSWWCHPSISSSVIPFSYCLSSVRVFSNESVLWIRWPNYWSFSFNISPSNEHSRWSPLGWTGWISLKSKGLSRSPPTPQSESFNFSALSLLYGSTLTSIHDSWKNHCFD